MEESKKSYYAIIPANVRYDKSLPPNAKLLYGEITALCNERGYCWATNKYFADLYSVSTTSVSKWISALCDGGYIQSKITYKEGTKEIDKRYITIVQQPIEEKLNTPIEKKLKENTTSSFNTTKNKKKERKTSYDEILSSVQDNSLKELYLEYIKMRKLIKAPLTDRALEMLIRKVNKLEPSSIANQKKLLENAIMNNWKSVYPLKPDEKENPRIFRGEQQISDADYEKLFQHDEPKALPTEEEIEKFKKQIEIDYPDLEPWRYEQIVESFMKGEWE